MHTLNALSHRKGLNVYQTIIVFVCFMGSAESGILLTAVYLGPTTCSYCECPLV